jgi:hypothetical protein
MALHDRETAGIFESLLRNCDRGAISMGALIAQVCLSSAAPWSLASLIAPATCAVDEHRRNSHDTACGDGDTPSRAAEGHKPDAPDDAGHCQHAANYEASPCSMPISAHYVLFQLLPVG